MRIPVFGQGVSSRSRPVTPAISQNFYLESRPAGEKSEIVAYGTPGLDLFDDSAGDTPWRGLLPVETTAFSYGVHRGTFYQIANDGTLTSRGTLTTTTGRVDMTHNGTVVLIVDGTHAYTYTIATTTFATVGSNLIANPKTCAWLDQYFIVENGVVFQISADGTTWAAADIGVPEASPDGIVKVFADHGELIVFGEITTEFWVDNGATDFPFQPLKSSTSEWGCASAWSVCKFNDGVAFLGKNRMGQVSACKLTGYAATPISTPDIDSIVNGYASAADATAFSYMLGGHPIYQINFPAAGKSWQYDALASHWSPRVSAGLARQRCEIGINYLNRTLLSDYSTGALYTLNPDTYTENGAEIASELITNNVALPDKQRFIVDCFRVDMETGVGLATGQGSNPQAMLQVSRDGGRSWGYELWEPIGKIGEFTGRVEWRRLGECDQIAFKLRITDPVKRTIISGCINPDD